MSTSPQVSLMGRIAVSAKLITQEQLLEALRAQDHMGTTKHLGDILLELGYISQAQLEWLRRAQATLVERQHQAEAEAQRQAQIEQQKSFTKSCSIVIPPGEALARPAPAAPASPPVAAPTVQVSPAGERKLDMSGAAVAARLQTVSDLLDLCQALGQKGPPANPTEPA
jgi:hypothetical protein